LPQAIGDRSQGPACWAPKETEYWSGSSRMHLNDPSGPQALVNDSSGDGGVFPMGHGYPVEYQHLVHSHWRGFREAPIYYHAGFYMAFVVMMLLNLFGNGLVIWIFST